MTTSQEEEIRNALIDAANHPDLATPEIELLRIGNNYVYSDQANKLVYRIPVRDSDRTFLVRENDVIVKLHHNGAPILPPTQIDPLKLSTGHLATCWPLGSPAESDPVQSLAPVLADLHQTQAVDGLPVWGGFERGRYRVNVARSLGVPRKLIDEVEQRLESLTRDFPSWSTATVVHGDPHVGNLVQFQGQHLLIDLDDLAMGCPEIDMATMCTAYRRFDSIPGTWDSFLEAYGREVDEHLLEWFVQLRQLTMVSWLFTLWGARPESQKEAIHRTETLDEVAKWNPL